MIIDFDETIPENAMFINTEKLTKKEKELLLDKVNVTMNNLKEVEISILNTNEATGDASEIKKVPAIGKYTVAIKYKEEVKRTTYWTYLKFLFTSSDTGITMKYFCY